MEPILDYLRKEYENLKKEVNPTEQCIGIAAAVASILTQSGKPPDIMYIEERIEGRDGLQHRRQFRPTLFKEILWEGHECCRYAGEIYDPLIGEPVPEEEYCNRAFGEEIPMNVLISSNYVKYFMDKMQ